MPGDGKTVPEFGQERRGHGLLGSSSLGEIGRSVEIESTAWEPCSRRLQRLSTTSFDARQAAGVPALRPPRSSQSGWPSGGPGTPASSSRIPLRMPLLSNPGPAGKANSLPAPERRDGKTESPSLKRVITSERHRCRKAAVVLAQTEMTNVGAMRRAVSLAGGFAACPAKQNKPHTRRHRLV